MEPGHDAEWARLDAEKRHALTPAPDTPVEEIHGELPNDPIPGLDG
jgi:hypothetical protein